MRMGWRATMPKSDPPEGIFKHVFSTKSSTGARLEHEGDITTEQYNAIWKILCPEWPQIQSKPSVGQDSEKKSKPNGQDAVQSEPHKGK